MTEAIYKEMRNGNSPKFMGDIITDSKDPVIFNKDVLQKIHNISIIVKVL